MTGLFGWVPDRPADAWPTLAAMGCALRSHRQEAWAAHLIDGIGIGVLDGIEPWRAEEWAAPALSPDGEHALWLAGEIFDAGGDTPPEPQQAPGARVRAAVLTLLIHHGPSALRAIDGEYQIAWWDRRRRRLTLLSDRFGGLPWYWTRGSQGIAFGCGVRGVLMAPDIAREPDLDALADATTFGGFRLGSHTNVRGIRMLPGAAVAAIAGGEITVSRWWRWTDLQQREHVSLEDAIEGAHERWQKAVARRLAGAARPGQTLSGGLDSRAILAEAAPRAPHWAAITYGVPGCEDARYAKAATRALGARWLFAPLYQHDWLARRTSHIQQTDGLIQLVDLLHLESLPLQREQLDVHLSGYIGDAVAGPTFNDIATPESALLSLPYYETALSRGWSDALRRVDEATEDGAWLASRFVPFEHKLPQSTNRWSAAWRPWFRVRKPFTDYAFFDFCQSLPSELRGAGRFYERWLRRHYPAAFARIPTHKTGAPVAAASWRIALARATRAGRIASIALADRFRVPHTPWSRAFHDEPRAWSAPRVRAIIEATVLRPGSISVERWGRSAVAGLLDAWFSREAAPTQVIGALYTFEAYHEGLPAHLAAAATEARAVGTDSLSVTR